MKNKIVVLILKNNNNINIYIQIMSPRHIEIFELLRRYVYIYIYIYIYIDVYVGGDKLSRIPLVALRFHPELSPEFVLRCNQSYPTRYPNITPHKTYMT